MKEKSKLFTLEQVLSELDLKEMGSQEFDILHNSFIKEKERRFKEKQLKEKKLKEEKSKLLHENIALFLKLYPEHEEHKKCISEADYNCFWSSLSTIDCSTYCTHCVLTHIANTQYIDVYISDISFKFVN